MCIEHAGTLERISLLGDRELLLCLRIIYVHDGSPHRFWGVYIREEFLVSFGRYLGSRSHSWAGKATHIGAHRQDSP